MTLEERERRAYADGDVETAALLAEAMDPRSDRVEELEHEVRMLKADLAEAQSDG